MFLNDLLKVTFDKKITVYIEIDDTFKDLYSGSPNRIPDNLKNKNVGSIAAKSKEHLDIRIQE